MSRSFRLWLAVSALLMGARLGAVVNVISVSLSNSNPAPGSVVTVTIQYCAGQWEVPHWLVAARPSPSSTIASCPSAGQTFLVYAGINNGVPPSSSPANGFDSGVSEPSTGCPTRTQAFNVTIPGSLVPGTTYNLIAAAGAYWADCGAFDDSAFAPFTMAPPAASNSTLLKRVEGTAQNGELMLYWLDYDVFNSTGISVRDALPACATLVDAAPQPASGAAAGVSGGTVQWALPNADAAAPDPYRRQGSLWALVRFNGCPSQVCNTGEIMHSGTGGAWQPSNTVCQSIGQANVQLLKSQLDSGGNPVTTLPNGSQVQYVLQYQFSGSGLKCFDSFQPYALNSTWQSTGGVVASNPSGGSWQIPAGDPGTIGWRIINGGSPGEQIVQYNCTGPCQGSQYRVLLYDCPTAKPNGEDFCGGMVEADVRIDGNVVNGDTGLVIRADASGNAYLAVLTVDPYPGAAQPGSVGGHFQFQKNTAGSPCWNGQCGNPNNAACPAAMGRVMAPALAPQFGVWYTIKVLEQPMGHFYAKYWERGTPEPTGWLLDWNDNTGCNGPVHGCSAANGNAWRPGIAGQADLMSYDNFRLYSAASLSGAQLWDSVPLGIDYLSASPAANGAVPANNNAPGDMIRWDFTGNNFGAVGGVLYEGTGSFTWLGQADCSETITAVNRASLGAASPPLSNDSNSVSLFISGCNSPTVTPTRTPSPSATPTATPTWTPTSTPTATPSATATPSVTPSSTRTITPSASPSATPSATASDSPTPSATPTPSPSASASPTASPSVTLTTPYTPTATPTQSPSWTPSDTPSASPSPSATPSLTPSATPSLTYSDTPSATATPTATDSPTASPSATPSATSTPSPTASPSATITPTFSPSPTITETPVPLPHRMVLAAYNSAGERVRLLYEGPVQHRPGALQLSARTLAGGATLLIAFPGVLAGGGAQLAWDLRNDGGQALGGGAYIIKAELTDNFGAVTAMQEPLQLIPGGLQQSLRVYNSAGELVRSLPLAGVLGATRLELAGAAFALELDPAGGAAVQPLKVDVVGNAGPSTVSWDGLNDQGAPVASGSYTLQLVSHEGGRVSVVASRSVSVLKQGVAERALASALLAPNPLRSRQSLQLRYTPALLGPQQRLDARAYNLAGELVAWGSDPARGGRIDFGELKALAPGIYRLRLELRQGQALLQARDLKFAVVH